MVAAKSTERPALATRGSGGGGFRTGRTAGVGLGASLALHALLGLSLWALVDPAPARWHDRPVALAIRDKPARPAVLAASPAPSPVTRPAATAAPSSRHPAPVRKTVPAVGEKPVETASLAPRPPGPTEPGPGGGASTGNGGLAASVGGGGDDGGSGGLAGSGPGGGGGPSAATSGGEGAGGDGPGPGGPPLAGRRIEYALGVRRALQASGRYPAVARRTHQEGRVVLRLTVGDDGRVLDVRVEQSSERPARGGEFF